MPISLDTSGAIVKDGDGYDVVLSQTTDHPAPVDPARPYSAKWTTREPVVVASYAEASDRANAVHRRLVTVGFTRVASQDEETLERKTVWYRRHADFAVVEIVYHHPLDCDCEDCYARSDDFADYLDGLGYDDPAATGHTLT